MAEKIISILEHRFPLTDKDKEILKKNTRELNRSERHYYFGELKPREQEFKNHLKEILQNNEPRELRDYVVSNLLDRKGDPSIADSLLMDVLGRLEVYRALREKAAREGIKLKALNNFGGISMVIALVGIITALVLYLLGR